MGEREHRFDEHEKLAATRPKGRCRACRGQGGGCSSCGGTGLSEAQRRFDAKEAAYVEHSGVRRGDLPGWRNRK